MFLSLCRYLIIIVNIEILIFSSQTTQCPFNVILFCVRHGSVLLFVCFSSL